MLENLDVEAVLHCGDIGSAEVVSLLSRRPCHYVLGNVDEAAVLRRAIEAAGQAFHERFGSLEWCGVKIAFLHGDDSYRLNQTVRSGNWGLVCHGHTHVAHEERVGQTLVLNPGALHRARRHTVATVELPKLNPRLRGFNLITMALEPAKPPVPSMQVVFVPV